MDNIHAILGRIIKKDKDPNAETMDDILEDPCFGKLTEVELMTRIYKCRHKTDEEYDAEEKKQRKKDEEDEKKWD